MVAMIGAIVLTHRKRDGVKRQNVHDQIMRRALVQRVLDGAQ